MTSLNAHLEHGLLRPIRERLPMTEHIPNHWLAFGIGTGGATGIGMLAGADVAVGATIITAFGVAIATVWVTIGQARIKVDRERLAFEREKHKEQLEMERERGRQQIEMDKERATALDGTFAGKLEKVSQDLESAKEDRHRQEKLIEMLQSTADEMKSRVEDANKKLHDAANRANVAALRHAEEMELLSKQHASELADLRGELAKVNGQLTQANEQLTALRAENERLNKLVQVTAKKTVQNTTAIEATAAKVDRMQQDSGSFAVVAPNAANEPTVDMPTMPGPTQPSKPL